MSEKYTKKQLEEMNRLNLRRVCKGHGMSSEECAKTDFDDLVDWVLEQQGDGGGGGGAKGKGKEKDKKDGGKRPPARGKPSGGAKGKDKLKGRGKGKAKDDAPAEAEAEAGGGELVGDRILNLLETLGEKVDTIGRAMDDNFSELNDAVNELRADVYGNGRRVKHMGDWLEAEEILTPDNAPDGLGFQELEAEIESEVSGNEDGDGDGE
jgi:hypothetical protein